MREQGSSKKLLLLPFVRAKFFELASLEAQRQFETRFDHFAVTDAAGLSARDSWCAGRNPFVPNLESKRLPFSAPAVFE